VRGALRAAALLLLAAAVPQAFSLPEDADQPIHIKADSAEMDQESGRVTYRGSVQMDQGTMRVTSDVMVIEVEDDQVVRITAEGELAHYEQQLKLEQSKVSADARTIVYHTQDERVELIGDAHLSQNDNEFKGERIHYDVRGGIVDASAADGGRVEMIFQPKKTATPP